MGGVISSITDAIGLTNTKAQKSQAAAATAAQQSANKQAAASEALSQEQLDFQKQQYADWKAVYGDLETNLGDYYKNLTPDTLENLGLQNQEQEYQAAIKQNAATFAKAGMTGSGAELASTSSGIFANAQARAAIRTNAPEQVAKEKEQFLGIGLGQGTSELQTIAQSSANVTNAFSSGINSSTNMAGQFLNSSTQYGIQNLQNTSTVVGAATGYYLPTGGK